MLQQVWTGFVDKPVGVRVGHESKLSQKLKAKSEK